LAEHFIVYDCPLHFLAVYWKKKQTGKDCPFMPLPPLEPASVFRFFEALSQIPRGSGNEKAVSDYVKRFALEKKLEVVQDEYHNLIIKKPASPGYENHEAVILQAHLDMVCEKNTGTEHDFETDPIELVLVGDILRANNTTLGADNGIAVAVYMALLDGAFVHPPLEVVLTADEEAGMSGAEKIDLSSLKGRRMINLDSSEEGIFFAGCAGGIKAAYRLPHEWEESGAYTAAYRLTVKGLQGGHSGGEINRERGNSIRILGRLLYDLLKKTDARIACVQGGMKLNAIPREAEAVVAVRPSDAETVKSIVACFAEEVSDEYRVADPGLTVIVNETDGAKCVLSRDCGHAIVQSLLLLPNGVAAMSLDTPGLVETSCNIGVVEQNEHITSVHIMPRSLVSSRLSMIRHQIQSAADATGAKVYFSNRYEPWAYNPQSALRETAVGVFRGLYDKAPQVTAVHAGLECGIFGGKIPGLDMISFGPDIWELHTPHEHLSASSVKRVWEYLLALLKSL
jgi:dipeptidase D